MTLDKAQLKYDLSLAQVKVAEAQIETANANLYSAKTNLNYTTIRSRSMAPLSPAMST